MTSYTQERPLRVAVIGSGPSGIYAAEALTRQANTPVSVDVYDRLPTPYGLVRYGVAPDHLTIKSVTKGFEKTLSDPRVRFLGNVEFGQDITHAEVKDHYDAVIYTVGASSDRKLNIPGEELRGSMSATEFVAWYNGHPDAAKREMVMNATGVAVVGVGNVALDVARILVKTQAELHESDIADHALKALVTNPVKDVWILGRRGPAQAAFTTKELREFGELQASEPMVSESEMTLTEAEEAAITDNVKKKNVEVLRDFAGREEQGKERRVHFRFLTSPVEILSDGQGNVAGLKLEKNRLDENGNAVGTGVYETIPVQMVLRSVGYRGVPLPGVPYDDKRGVIPNVEGRVTDRPGEYTAGWIKRGPSGVVGTNRKCAADTVTLLLQDANDGKLPAAPHASPAELDALLKAKGVDVFTFNDWQELEAHELAQGKTAGRPRQKVVLKEEMLRHRRASATIPSATTP